MYLSQMFALQKELDRLFGRDYSPYSTYGRRSYPAVNLFEKDDQLVLKSEVPGIDKKDLDISLENDVLTIKGELGKGCKEDVKFHRQERSKGIFQRSVKLPYQVDSEKVLAKLENGILTVTLEREESTKPRSIAIS